MFSSFIKKKQVRKLIFWYDKTLFNHTHILAIEG